MEDLAGKPGLFERIFSLVQRTENEEFEDDRDVVPTSHLRVNTNHSHHFTVRKQIVAFQDAVIAADGLKRGETQVINLSLAPPDLREKIKDFMCGVNYTAEGSWEEIGDNVYLLAPGNIYVELAPSSPATTATQRVNGFN